MPQFFFPTFTDGQRREDPIGSEHETADAAIKEGQTYAREMALERLRMGEITFEETVEVRDQAGALLATRTIRVTGSDSQGG